MPEIGATLREARMRARIDISEIESETKIRAKYLRALENEEWDLLPGPTYVKSFLRTYAEALDLDAKLILEEYKARHERPSAQDMMPITPAGRSGGRGGSRRGRSREPRRRLGPGPIIIVMVLALLVVLFALGKFSRDNKGDNSSANGPVIVTTSTATTATTTTSAAERKRVREAAARKKAAARVVTLQVIPTAPVFVCLEQAGGRRPINGIELAPSTSVQSYRSSRFRLTLGNSSARLRVDGRLVTVPPSSNGIGYEITKNKRKRLSPSQRPTCAPTG
jgi:cytoskeleton protein RodZ